MNTRTLNELASLVSVLDEWASDIKEFGEEPQSLVPGGLKVFDSDGEPLGMIVQNDEKVFHFVSHGDYA